MRILVTGGAGFIGSHLVEQLVRDGHDVRVLDDLSNGKLDNLRGFLDVAAPRHFWRGDIRSFDTCHKTVQGCEAVFHLAALGSVPRSIENPFTTNEVNVTGTLNMLEASRRNGVERFVFASSSSVYGASPAGWRFAGPPGVRTEDDSLAPTSPYGVSKLAAEHYCSVWRTVHGLQTTSLRFFNVFGPRQNPDGPYAAVIPKFIRACLRGDVMPVYGDGTQTRDFTYVENVVEACMKALERGLEGAFNVGCGEGSKVFDLATNIGKLCCPERYRVLYAAPRPGDVRRSVAAIERARAVLRYAPTVDVEEGLKRTVEWFRKQEG